MALNTEDHVMAITAMGMDSDTDTVMAMVTAMENPPERKNSLTARVGVKGT